MIQVNVSLIGSANKQPFTLEFENGDEKDFESGYTGATMDDCTFHALVDGDHTYKITGIVNQSGHALEVGYS